MARITIIRTNLAEDHANYHEAMDAIASLNAFISDLPDAESQTLAGRMLDLAVVAANTLAGSPTGVLDTALIDKQMDTMDTAHVVAAVARLAMAHESSTAGALQCIQDMGVVIRSLQRAP